MSSSTDNSGSANNNNNNNNNNKKKKTDEDEVTDDFLKALKKTIPGMETTDQKGPFDLIPSFITNYRGYTNFSRGTVTLELENKANEFFEKGEITTNDITKFHRLDTNRLGIAVTCTITLSDIMVARMMWTRLRGLNFTSGHHAPVALGAFDVEYNEEANPKQIVATMYFSAEKEYVGSDAFIAHVEGEIDQGYRNDGMGGLTNVLYNTDAFWDSEWPVYEENLNPPGFGNTTTDGLPPNSYIMDYHYFQDTLTERVFPLVGEVISQVLSAAFGPQMIGVTTRYIPMMWDNNRGHYVQIRKMENETEEAFAERKESFNLLLANTWFNDEQRDGYIADIWSGWLLYSENRELDDPTLFQAPEIEAVFLIHNVQREKIAGKQPQLRDLKF